MRVFARAEMVNGGEGNTRHDEYLRDDGNSRLTLCSPVQTITEEPASESHASTFDALLTCPFFYTPSAPRRK